MIQVTVDLSKITGTRWADLEFYEFETRGQAGVFLALLVAHWPAAEWFASGPVDMPETLENAA